MRYLKWLFQDETSATRAAKQRLSHLLQRNDHGMLEFENDQDLYRELYSLQNLGPEFVESNSELLPFSPFKMFCDTKDLFHPLFPKWVWFSTKLHETGSFIFFEIKNLD